MDSYSRKTGRRKGTEHGSAPLPPSSYVNTAFNPRNIPRYLWMLNEKHRVRNHQETSKNNNNNVNTTTNGRIIRSSDYYSYDDDDTSSSSETHHTGSISTRTGLSGLQDDYSVASSIPSTQNSEEEEKRRGKDSRYQHRSTRRKDHEMSRTNEGDDVPYTVGASVQHPYFVLDTNRRTYRPDDALSSSDTLSSMQRSDLPLAVEGKKNPSPPSHANSRSFFRNGWVQSRIEGDEKFIMSSQLASASHVYSQTTSPATEEGTPLTSNNTSRKDSMSFLKSFRATSSTPTANLSSGLPVYSNSLNENKSVERPNLSTHLKRPFSSPANGVSHRPSATSPSRVEKESRRRGARHSHHTAKLHQHSQPLRPSTAGRSLMSADLYERLCAGVERGPIAVDPMHVYASPPRRGTVNQCSNSVPCPLADSARFETVSMTSLDSSMRQKRDDAKHSDALGIVPEMREFFSHHHEEGRQEAQRTSDGSRSSRCFVRCSHCHHPCAPVGSPVPSEPAASGVMNPAAGSEIQIPHPPPPRNSQERKVSTEIPLHKEERKESAIEVGKRGATVLAMDDGERNGKHNSLSTQYSTQQNEDENINGPAPTITSSEQSTQTEQEHGNGEALGGMEGSFASPLKLQDVPMVSSKTPSRTSTTIQSDARQSFCDKNVSTEDYPLLSSSDNNLATQPGKIPVRTSVVDNGGSPVASQHPSMAYQPAIVMAPNGAQYFTTIPQFWGYCPPVAPSSFPSFNGMQVSTTTSHHEIVAGPPAPSPAPHTDDAVAPNDQCGAQTTKQPEPELQPLTTPPTLSPPPPPAISEGPSDVDSVPRQENITTVTAASSSEAKQTETTHRRRPPLLLLQAVGRAYVERMLTLYPLLVYNHAAERRHDAMRLLYRVFVGFCCRWALCSRYVSSKKVHSPELPNARPITVSVLKRKSSLSNAKLGRVASPCTVPPSGEEPRLCQNTVDTNPITTTRAPKGEGSIAVVAPLEWTASEVPLAEFANAQDSLSTGSQNFLETRVGEWALEVTASVNPEPLTPFSAQPSNDRESPFSGVISAPLGERFGPPQTDRVSPVGASHTLNMGGGSGNESGHASALPVQRSFNSGTLIYQDEQVQGASLLASREASTLASRSTYQSGRRFSQITPDPNNSSSRTAAGVTLDAAASGELVAAVVSPPSPPPVTLVEEEGAALIRRVFMGAIVRHRVGFESTKLRVRAARSLLYRVWLGYTTRVNVQVCVSFGNAGFNKEKVAAIVREGKQVFGGLWSERAYILAGLSGRATPQLTLDSSETGSPTASTPRLADGFDVSTFGSKLSNPQQHAWVSITPGRDRPLSKAGVRSRVARLILPSDVADSTAQETPRSRGTKARAPRSPLPNSSLQFPALAHDVGKDVPTGAAPTHLRLEAAEVEEPANKESDPLGSTPPPENTDAMGLTNTNPNIVPPEGTQRSDEGTPEESLASPREESDAAAPQEDMKEFIETQSEGILTCNSETKLEPLLFGNAAKLVDQERQATKQLPLAPAANTTNADENTAEYACSEPAEPLKSASLSNGENNNGHVSGDNASLAPCPSGEKLNMSGPQPGNGSGCASPLAGSINPRWVRRTSSMNHRNSTPTALSSNTFGAISQSCDTSISGAISESMNDSIWASTRRSESEARLMEFADLDYLRGTTPFEADLILSNDSFSTGDLGSNKLGLDSPRKHSETMTLANADADGADDDDDDEEDEEVDPTKGAADELEAALEKMVADDMAAVATLRLSGLDDVVRSSAGPTDSTAALLQRIGRGYAIRNRCYFNRLLDVAWLEIATLFRVCSAFRVRRQLGRRRLVVREAKADVQRWEQRHRSAISLQKVLRGFLARQRTKELQRKVMVRTQLRVALEEQEL